MSSSSTKETGPATSTESEHPPLTAISNEAAALHREHFGRGPAAVRSTSADDLIVCILVDAFTPLERTLIRAGRGDRVTMMRSVHRDAVEEVCRERMGAVVGRPVNAYLSAVRPEDDIVVDVYILAPAGTESGSTGTRAAG